MATQRRSKRASAGEDRAAETSRQEDRAKFIRLANKRVPAAVKAISLIGNLANRSNYVFSDEDAKAIARVLKGALADMEARFAGRDTAVPGFELKE